MSLIEKLEGVTDGSRELDAEIALAVGYTRAWHEDMAPNRGGWYWRNKDIGPTHETYDWPPLFSSSLDAALTLVPEGGWQWQIRQDPNVYRAAIVGGIVPDLKIMRGLATSPALALCIAALKARTP